MSGTYPTTPEFASIGFTSEQETITSTTDSGKMFAVQVDGQRFKFSASYPPMSRSDFAPVYAFIMKQRSQKETFQIALPDLKNAKGDVSGTITVSGSHSAGDTTINITGISNTIKAGDFVKFGGHSKVYMVQEDANASGGLAAVKISPNLVSSLADNEAVTVNKPSFTVYLENNDIMYSTDASGFYSISFDVREVIT